MKKVFTLFFVLTVKIAFGQIDENLMKSMWKTGKEKTIYGNNILRLEGKNDIGGVLNVGYQTFSQLKTELIKEAEREMWTPDKKKETIEMYEKFSIGGLIHIYLERLTINSANTDKFTVIVRDESDNNEILRKELDATIPNTPKRGSDYWWNYTAVPIPQKISGKVYIYVIDRVGQENNKHKFEITLK